MAKYKILYTIEEPKFRIVEANTADEACELLKTVMTNAKGNLVIKEVQDVKRYMVEYKCLAYYQTLVEATSRDEAIANMKERLKTGPCSCDVVKFLDSEITDVMEA